ncbi:MAG TPA: hypothetical protein VFM93_00330 [Candidatus Limnocylindria bacterium]|nr:hypothetical protein [Candidatus Limnocylindria bacterium]
MTFRTEDAVDLSFILSIVALICGILMLVGARVRAPLAAIAIVCLAVVQSGILSRLGI